LGEILFDKLGLPAIKKTKTGYSTDNQVLTELSQNYEIARKIVDYRSYTKLNSTYITALPKLINKKTGRVHTTFNQTVASTGRLSSTNPNLQNIPIKTDYGKEIRKAFVAKNEDYLILSADYSQIELRIMAYYSGDEHLINAFNEGIDIHSATASKLFNKKLADVNQDDRRVAKTVNFGIMYGLGSFGLSQRLGISRSYAKEIIDNYFASYPGIKSFMDNIIQSTREKLYAEAICGRRRYFKDINNTNHNIRAQDERAAINLPIQGSASDMIKIAMISVHNYLKSNPSIDAKMLLQVHDELLFEVHKNHLDELTRNVKNLMQNALTLDRVPILVETGSGENWYLAH
jgi:DNA polymerase-1